MRGPQTSARKKTVRFNSAELAEQNAQSSEGKAVPARYSKDDPGGSRIFAAESLGGMPQGNEQLSRVFALLQDWLGVNGVSGRQNADSEHWHRYVCGIGTLHAIVHVSLLLVCVSREDYIIMHLSPIRSLSIFSPNLMKSAMNGDIRSAATQEHVMLLSKSKQNLSGSMFEAVCQSKAFIQDT